MGTEILIPLALAALGTGAAYVNNRNVAHRQDQQLAAQLRAQQAKQRQADARTAQLITQEGASTSAPEKQQGLAAMQQQLALRAGQATQPLTTYGNASTAAAKSARDAAQGIASYGSNLSDLLSSIDAPGYQRQREQRDIIDPYKQDIGLLSRANAGDNFVSNLKLRNIRGNPLLSLLSGVSGGVAQAIAAGYGNNQQAAAPASPWYTRPNLTNDLPDVTGTMGIW